MKHDTYLIAHTDKSGKNVAQTSIRSASETEARKQFENRHPERDITAVGIKGQS